MNRYSYDESGRLRRFWDATARLRYEYDANGAQIGDPHPFTADENARADAEAAARLAESNEATILSRIRDAIATNAAAITQLQNFAAGTAALTNTSRDSALRDLANQQARALRQINALARLAARDLGSTDGT